MCGDGITVGTTYDCDDGDNDSDDGCSDVCALEDGWICEFGDSSTADTCREICGDGYRWTTEFECDDANNDDNDGCSAGCAIEAGWLCDRAADGSNKDECSEICGDGINNF
ncbi:hypothetical protein COB52_05855 [Candidatus Kaiserbacteria bacterium]|nr:MAG: hypothetical protein COB52_05855 [Candidatus Kaiserbacteria bacterium]